MKHSNYSLVLLLLTALSVNSYAETVLINPTAASASTKTTTMTTTTEQSNVIKEDTTPPAPEGPLPATQVAPLLNSGKTPTSKTPTPKVSQVTIDNEIVG